MASDISQQRSGGAMDPAESLVDDELENYRPQRRAARPKKDSAGSDEHRTSHQIERKRLSDRRSQRLVRERNKLQFQTMKAKLESLQASDSNAEIKRLLEENDILRQKNRKLQESLDAVVGILLPLHHCDATESNQRNATENPEAASAKSVIQIPTSSQNNSEGHAVANSGAPGQTEFEQTVAIAHNDPLWDFLTGEVLCDTNSSDSDCTQNMALSIHGAPNIFSSTQAAGFLPSTSASLLNTPGVTNATHHAHGLSSGEEADNLHQVNTGDTFLGLFEAIPGIDQSTIARDQLLFSHVEEPSEELLPRPAITHQLCQNLPSISSPDTFNAIRFPLELTRKTCLIMQLSQHELPHWHSKYWFDGWVIKAIELHRNLSKGEFDNSLPKQPCLCALFQPWQCRRSLAKKIAAMILKSLPGAGLAEKIAIYTMLHGLFRVSNYL
jgi:hypothetical protein